MGADCYSHTGRGRSSSVGGSFLFLLSDGGSSNVKRRGCECTTKIAWLCEVCLTMRNVSSVIQLVKLHTISSWVALLLISFDVQSFNGRTLGHAFDELVSPSSVSGSKERPHQNSKIQS